MNARRRLNRSRIGPKGTSTDLMPCIMGAIDAIWEKESDPNNETITTTGSDSEDNETSTKSTTSTATTGTTNSSRSSTPKRTVQANGFANLSPNVQKILSNVPDEELNRNFSSEESLGAKRFAGDRRSSHFNRSQRSPEKSLLDKSTESLDIISPGVQKMLSNLPDGDLVNKNRSFLHGTGKTEPAAAAATTNGGSLRGSKSFCGSSSRASFLHQRKSGHGKDLTAACSVSENYLSAADDGAGESGVNIVVVDDRGSSTANSNVPRVASDDSFAAKPLGNYSHTSPSGIASRTPAGRKNLGKSLQVPSESSVGTSSTASSEVSRPVSLTSLGSCSSSSSSGGPHQPSSAYLASAESLDSDPEPTGSQGSADSGIAEQPTMSPEQCVLQEVMDTETVYVADLREVIEGYLDPWRTHPNCPLAEHLQDLFSNLEEIYAFNRSFLEDLQRANCDPTLTANAFLRNDSGFSVYSEYCTHYPRTMTVLTELTGDEGYAALFRERQIALGHALPLGSYLLKPVQRILKYHLLLQRLSKQCEQPHKSTVDLALTTMTGVASHINTMKRKHEHAVRVQEIQSQLYGWTGPDLTALGELIAEGTFRVGGARGRRHVFLFDKVLLIAKSKQDGCLAYKCHIMCSNLMLVEQVRGEPLSFHILPFDNPRQQCTLRARSPQHKREWTLQLKRVIIENYSAVIPSHARQLVMQLGQNLQADEDTSDKWSPLKQHSTPQYLERRSRVRKSRDFSNGRAASQDRSFGPLASWRRKSEPGIVNQYTSKTLPKRITKIKKAKDHETAKFYTDLSDSENCDTISELNDGPEASNEDKCCEDVLESSPVQGASTTLEKVVSDLLMQNEEFQKLLNRQRRSIRDGELTTNWSKPEPDELPSKADSLPRDFQLNDQLECKGDSVKPENARDHSSLDAKQTDVDIEDLQESDLSSRMNDGGEHPDHRIYRKSTIRFSLVQRFRAIISEEQRRVGKLLPTHMQGSESMGAKIANPDYADPHKLFRASRCDLNVEPEDSLEDPKKQNHCSTNKENMEEKISCHSLDDIEEDSGGCSNRNSSQSTKSERTTSTFNSSQNSDGYYERLMEKNLNEECSDRKEIRRKSSSYKMRSVQSKSKEEQIKERKSAVKRPSKAPPPIPVKPTRLLLSSAVDNSKENVNSFTMKIGDNKESPTCDRNFHTGRRRIFVSKAVYEVSNESKLSSESSEALVTDMQPMNSRGWVKTIVGRFE